MNFGKLNLIVKRIFRVLSVAFWSLVLIVGLGNVTEAITKNPFTNLSGINLYSVASKSMASIDESNRDFLADKRGGFLKINDVVVVKRLENERLEEGDIITYVNKNKLTIIHRIYKIKSDGKNVGYVTRGDANNVNDPDILQRNDIKGVYLFRIPYVGEFAFFFKSKYGLTALLSVGFITFLFGYLKEKELERFGPLYYSVMKNLDGI